MKAELVMIGTELLLGETVDTNASFLASELAKLGIDLYYKSTVGDNWLRMIHTITQALSRSDVVITSGGLGPTEDDLTREAIAALTDRPLKENLPALAGIQEYFAGLNRVMSENNKKQAYLPEGALIIGNQWGTAPGFILELPGGKIVLTLPGVPRELKGMFRTTVAPYLQAKAGGSCLLSRTLKFAGIGESQLVALAQEIISAQNNPSIAPYASLGEVKIRLTAKAATPAQAVDLIAPVENQLRELLGTYYYGADQDTLESVVGAILAKSKWTLATAESCTGGLVANRITDVPGSSDYFLQGYVTYSNEAKIKLLGVDPQLIAKYGAVSQEVALAMAAGVREAADTTWGLGITGIAGPGGATAAKPVGLVHIAVARKGYTNPSVYRFTGNRKEIKYRAAQAALNFLRTSLN